MKKISSALLILISVFLANAQDLSSVKLESISAELKFVDQDASSPSFDQISLLAKNRTLFTPIDITSFHPSIITFKVVSNGNIVFQSPSGLVDDSRAWSHARYSLNISFLMLNQKTNEYRKKRELQLGLFYQPWRYHQSPYTRADTITSDSVNFSYAYYDEWSPILGVQSAYILRTNPDNRVVGYGGLAVGIGVSVHPQIAETFGVISVKANDTASIPQYTFLLLSNTQNIFSAKSSVLLEGRIPFGISFRIIKGVNLFFQGEVVASKQIYFQTSLQFPVRITPAGSTGLKLRF